MLQRIYSLSDVTNNYEDLDELYQELHDTWSRYVGRSYKRRWNTKIEKPNQKGSVRSSI
jgi:hypothetical protein